MTALKNRLKNSRKTQEIDDKKPPENTLHNLAKTIEEYNGVKNTCMLLLPDTSDSDLEYYLSAVGYYAVLLKKMKNVLLVTPTENKDKHGNTINPAVLTVEFESESGLVWLERQLDVKEPYEFNFYGEDFILRNVNKPTLREYVSVCRENNYPIFTEGE